LPKPEEHLRQAEHNEKLAETLAKTAYLDWAVIVYFYAAIHYLSLVLAAQGSLPTSHAERDPLVKRHPNLAKIFNEYKALDIMSRNARYYCTPIDPGDVTSVQQKFAALRTYIGSLTGVDKPGK
jgi:hypothetical protein